MFYCSYCNVTAWRLAREGLFVCGCPSRKEVVDLKSERASLSDVIAEQKRQLQQLTAYNAELYRVISDAYQVVKHNLQVCWMQYDPIKSVTSSSLAVMNLLVIVQFLSFSFRQPRFGNVHCTTSAENNAAHFAELNASTQTGHCRRLAHVSDSGKANK